MIHHRLGRDRAARDDLNRALALAPSRKARGVIHYNLALIDLAAGDRKSCDANVASALELGNPDALELSRATESVGCRGPNSSAVQNLPEWAERRVRAVAREPAGSLRPFLGELAAEGADLVLGDHAELRAEDRVPWNQPSGSTKAMCISTRIGSRLEGRAG